MDQPLIRKSIDRIKVLQEQRGVIVFTDPDFPGNKIRQAVMQYVPDCKHAHLQKGDAIAKKWTWSLESNTPVMKPLKKL